jgi:DMSO/TMAO reductase YedYZ molybdopterin-dependent catalytic subunit
MVLHISGTDAELAAREARKRIAANLDAAARRSFLRRSFTLGGLSLLGGSSLTDGASIELALSRVSRFNDRVQAWLFDPARLAPTYPEAMVARPFPFNAYYGEDEIRELDAGAWRLEVSGRVTDRRPWSLRMLAGLPQESQVTRHICVEGWSAIGQWGGVPLRTLLARVGADLGAKYVGFRCADDYATSIDMATALHPQTLIALSFDGAPLPPKYGLPAKVRIPTKLGYKNPKHITALFVTNTYPGGYWEDQGYNWFGGS